MSLENRISRRAALRRIFIEGPLAYWAFVSIRDSTIPEVEGVRTFEDLERITEPSNTPVSIFADDIVNRSNEITDHFYEPVSDLNISALYGYLAMLGVVEYTIRRDKRFPERSGVFNFFRDIAIPRGNVMRNGMILSGFLGASLGRALDIYSTTKVAKLMQDPRFTEYGLHQIYYEEQLRDEAHPSPEDYKKPESLMVEGFGVGLGTLFPAFGSALAVLGIDMYANNDYVLEHLRTSIAIGDSVKEKIGKEGYNDKQVLDHIRMIKYSDLKLV